MAQVLSSLRKGLGLEIQAKNVNISGFLRQFCGRFSKVKIHLPIVRIGILSILSTHPEVLQALSPLTATNLLVLFVEGEGAPEQGP